MSTNTKKYYLKSLIGLTFMFGFRYLPPIGPLTSLGMQVTGIFIGLIYLCCVVDIIWPSMIGLIALGMTDYCTVTEAISSSVFGTNS